MVLDTNVLVRNLKSPHRDSPNKRIVRLWLQRNRLQLALSRETIAEYLETFVQVLGMEPEAVADWRDHFEQDRRCTLVNLGRRFTESRDPDDNVFLATALAGRAEYLITNDRDLLDLPEDFQRTLPFAIVTPAEFLREFESE